MRISCLAARTTRKHPRPVVEPANVDYAAARITGARRINHINVPLYRYRHFNNLLILSPQPLYIYSALYRPLCTRTQMGSEQIVAIEAPCYRSGRCRECKRQVRRRIVIAIATSAAERRATSVNLYLVCKYYM